MKTRVKKIAIVFNNLNIGGIETKIIDLCRYYSLQKNTKLFLILKSKSGPLLHQIPSKITIIHPHITDKFKIKTFLFPFWIASVLRNINPDLIIAFGNYSAISTLIGKTLASNQSKLIISEDSSIIQQLKSDTFSHLRTFLVKIFYRFSDSIIVLSASGKKNLLQLNSHLKAKITVLNNWLPLTYPKNKKTQNRDIDILFLGRFEAQKNPLEFLDISKELLVKNPNLNILMVGYGSLKKTIKKYIFNNKLSSNIHLHPKTTIAFKYFQDSKIFLLTSVHEGFPLTILESTASGSLPICVNLPEIREYFDTQSETILYNKKIEAVKNINYLLNHPPVLKQLSAYYQQKTLNSQQQNFQKTIDHINLYL